MEHQSTITTTTGHGIKAGDWISLVVPDTRWWRRLAYWLLRRGQPQRTIRRRVSQASTTTLALATAVTANATTCAKWREMP